MRIYVPYWPVGIAKAAAYVFFPDLSAGTREWDWLSSLTLMPTTREPAFIVAWTPQHEIFFYVLFGLAALSPQPLLGLSAGAAAIALWIILLAPSPKPVAGFLALIDLEFLFGIDAARLISTRRPRNVECLTASGVLISVFLFAGAQPEQRVIFGLGSGPIKEIPVLAII